MARRNYAQASKSYAAGMQQLRNQRAAAQKNATNAAPPVQLVAAVDTARDAVSVVAMHAANPLLLLPYLAISVVALNVYLRSFVTSINN